MAYFSNSSEGDVYEARYCQRCVHNNDEDGCPVMMLHFVFNGTQVAAANRAYNKQEIGDDGSAVAYMMLSELIPEKDGFPTQCKMFVLGRAIKQEVKMSETETISEGWGRPYISSKWHYFRGLRCLCGKYLYGGKLDDTPETEAVLSDPDNCKECVKRRRKELAALETPPEKETE